MSRKARKLERRLVLPDHKYHNIHIAKFINYLMERGKKTVAENIVYAAFDALVENRLKEDKTIPNIMEIQTNPEKRAAFVIELFLGVLNRIKPSARLKSKRIGGANYQVPMEIQKEVALKIAMKMLISVAKKKQGRAMHEKLFIELLNVINKEGDAIKQKNEMEKRIESSKAFAHFV